MRLRWIVYVLLAAAVSAPASAAVPDRERAALLALYNSTGGSNWSVKDGWNGAPGTECDWYGVSCDGARTTVVVLALQNNNLVGQFPLSVVDLTSLDELDLDENILTGPLPPQLSQLTKLRVLRVDYNKFTGAIPSAIGSLVNLERLSLQENTFSGAIPPELGRLSKLQELYLYANQLTGGIPRELAQDTALKVVELEYNKLSGPLPVEITTLPNLVDFKITNNGFSGPVPPEIGNLRNLEILDLTGNEFSGPLPSQIGNLTHIDRLWLGDNKFTGAVPDALFNLTTLTRLGLDHNQFTGPLDNFGRLTALTDLELEHNLFSGPVPASITSLTNLQYLDLSYNQLSGGIPDFDRMTSLLGLRLVVNQLTGPIPASFGRMTSLQALALSSNKLSGTIPPALGGMTSMVTLDLSDNLLTGEIPSSLRNLASLQSLSLGYNQLTGPVPDWAGSLPALDTLSLQLNNLSGPLPASLTLSTSLVDIDLANNQISGPIPADIGRLQKLQYIWLAENEMSGPLPESLFDLQNLTYLSLGANHFTGPVSPRLGAMAALTYVDLNANELTGTIPSSLGSLTSVYYLGLYGNRFTGTIPRELGQLKNLQFIDLSGNALRGPIPPELAGMTTLLDARSDFGYNALFTTDAALKAFINRVQYQNDYESTQTLPPGNVKVTATTDRSATVEWSPIAYLYDQGGYQVRASLTAGGTPVSVATTMSKDVTSIVVRGLQPSTTYFFNVASVTHPHDFQQNLIVSDPSAAVQATTTARTLAPADVDVTDWPKGLIQIDGKQVNQDSFTLTNFGDVPTTISLDHDDTGFFSLSQNSVTLGPGQSQTIQITTTPQPAGYKYGYISPHGDGVGSDVYLTVTLLSVVRAGGNAVAEALTSRVEIAGVAGSDSVGSVTFRNRGTARLNGILVADVPWIAPPTDPIIIDPGSQQLVRFTVVRSRRPAGIGDGALTATLSLIYVGELPESNSERSVEDTTPPAGVSVTKVTVVDTTKPDVGPANAPGLAAGEVAYFIAGLESSNSGSSSLASDLHMVNAFGAKPLNDVRLYYTSAAQKAVATLTPLLSNQAVTLANVAANVYGAGNQIGSLQIRSVNWQNLTMNASLLRLGGAAGTFISDLPVFRSDRALRVNEKLYFTGVSQPANVHATVVIEEIAGVDADLLVAFVDNAGVTSPTREVRLPAFATTEVTDVPTNTATMVVTNGSAASSSAVLAYVRMSDDASGDTWTVVDWSRLYQYSRSEAVRLPLVETSSAGGGKRRAAKHSDATSGPRFTTSVSLYNAGATDARAKIGSREIVVPGRQTTTINDIAAYAGISSPQSIVIEPTRGELSITSRTSAANSSGGTFGTAVPLVAAQSGLRLGQAQIFSGLEDSTAYRTDYGFSETSGAPATIRATILLSDSRSAFTTVVSRDFALAANGFVLTTDLVRSIVNSLRDKYGDLHDLQLQLQVTEGSGSILPFVVVNDNVTGDASLRLQ